MRAPIAWVRLRAGHHEYSLEVGEWSIGRASECAISFDDPNVSRRHAKIIVCAEGVLVEDLGSRNGVFVNGRRIAAPTPLAEGDLLSLGGQTIGVHRFHGPASTPAPPRLAPASPLTLDQARQVCTTLSQGIKGEEERILAYRMIADNARSALLRGAPREAEDLLERPLAEVLSTLRGGIPVEPELVELAASQALMLAEAQQKASWVEYVFDLYGVYGTPMPPRMLDRLVTAVVQVEPIDLGTIEGYLAKLRRATTVTEAEISLRARLEALLATLHNSRATWG